MIQACSWVRKEKLHVYLSLMYWTGICVVNVGYLLTS